MYLSHPPKNVKLFVETCTTLIPTHTSNIIGPRVLLPWTQAIVSPLPALILVIYDVKDEFGHVVFLWAI